jgi:LPXTG-motif cell wall-anchored protein
MIIRRIAGALLGALLVVGGSTTAALADDYGPATIDLSVSPTELTGGETFTGTATSNKDCTSWSVTYDGGTSSTNPATGSGTSISFSFTTNPVSDVENHTVTATCTYDDGTGTSDRSTALVPISRSADITVDPAGDVSPPTGPVGPGPDNGGTGTTSLPNTGGPDLWVLAAGLALLLGGAGAVFRARRARA